MARTRNIDSYDEARKRLLSIGVDLMRAESYAAIGINDVLKAAAVPRGSFYHYFESKQAFGLQVAQHYHDAQMNSARELLRDDGRPPLERLRAFFRNAQADYAARGFGSGCLMCNLSTEMADRDDAFQELLRGHWRELSDEIAGCIARLDRVDLGLEALSDQEAADWLLNAWSGALARMKAERSAAPLQLFEKSVFKKGNQGV